MATLTPTEWINKLDARIKEASEDKIMVACIQRLISKYAPRIFEQGFKSDGSDIGNYSTKKFLLYVKKDGSTPGSPQRKTADTFVPFASDKRAKTGKRGFFAKEYPGGYKQFKQDIGRGGRVNLQLFGELMKDASAVKLRKIDGGFDYILTKEINIKKREWMESKYGKIFNLTDKEKVEFIGCLKKNVLDILKK